MSVKFYVFKKNNPLQEKKTNCCYLSPDPWDDYHFKTKFTLSYVNDKGDSTYIGSLKIGRADLDDGWVRDVLPDEFEALDDSFFSLGQDLNYYKNLRTLFEDSLANEIMSSLCDIVLNDKLLLKHKDEQCMAVSLLRFVSITSLSGQFKRILDRKSPLSEFKFSYLRNNTQKKSAAHLNFHVTPNSKPSSNMHILIGRNGVGKTTIFNGIVNSIVKSNDSEEDDGYLVDDSVFSLGNRVPAHFFSSVISISFSAFDSFLPPPDRMDRSLGTCYYYIGLKNTSEKPDVTTLKNHDDLADEIVSSIYSCFNIEDKKASWFKAIQTLESDANFKENDLTQLGRVNMHDLLSVTKTMVGRLSSGHMIVLLILSRLIELVEEKSLVLIDEPECHLHPPLLSALLRAISDILIDRNAVAIVASHSPVVLQEVPSSCVWKLERSKLSGNSYRPDIETFGENVGVLTREVFGLEVSKSGFHNVLQKEIDEGKQFDEIVAEYGDQIGFEGRAILQSLLYENSLEFS